MARELHDVTSHAVGVMVVQAGAAAALAKSDRQAARGAVAEVERAGTHALAELDILSGILGQDGTTTEPDELHALIGRMSAGGLRITQDLGELDAEDPVLLRTAYRVVQEALTNALRHAPGSAVSVTAARDGDALEIRVTNDAPALAAPIAAPGSGFGLIGLTERVRALGGSLSAMPSRDEGFTVIARLPVTAP